MPDGWLRLVTASLSTLKAHAISTPVRLYTSTASHLLLTDLHNDPIAWFGAINRALDPSYSTEPALESSGHVRNTESS